jgi:hypothetical protein
MPNVSRLLALSMFSINCSRLSKAVSLFWRICSAEELEEGSGVERMTVMEWRIRSASEGPPRRVLRASGFRGRDVDSEVVVEVVVVVVVVGWEVEEFSMPHFRRSLRAGSFIVVLLLCIVFGVGEVWVLFSCIERVVCR